MREDGGETKIDDKGNEYILLPAKDSSDSKIGCRDIFVAIGLLGIFIATYLAIIQEFLSEGPFGFILGIAGIVWGSCLAISKATTPTLAPW